MKRLPLVGLDESIELIMADLDANHEKVIETTVKNVAPYALKAIMALNAAYDANIPAPGTVANSVEELDNMYKKGLLAATHQIGFEYNHEKHFMILLNELGKRLTDKYYPYYRPLREK